MGNSILQELAIRTPISTPTSEFTSLPSNSYMMGNRPYPFDRLHERRPSDSQRPFPSPSPPPPQPSPTASLGVDLSTSNAKISEKGHTTTALGAMLKPRPRKVKDFVGRKDILGSMCKTHFGNETPRSRSDAPIITVLTGMGGSGKTQIATSFASLFEERFPDIPVFFLDASSETSLNADLTTLVRSQTDKYDDDALTWLSNGIGNWLLIMDNADDPSLKLSKFLPRTAHGHVVVTTRNATHRLLAPQCSHVVDVLPMEDSVTLLLKSSASEDNEANRFLARKIAEELGRLPLALAHAAAYILINNCLDTFLDTYGESRNQFLRSTPDLPQDYPHSVERTIEMSFHCLSVRVQGIVTLFSHMDARSVARCIVERAAERQFLHIPWQSKLPPQPDTVVQAKILQDIFCPRGEWNSFEFDVMIEECLKYSLLQVSTTDGEKFYLMHPLVQTYIQSYSSTVCDYSARRLVIRLLGSATTMGRKYEFFRFNRLLSPHMRSIRLEEVMEAGDHLGFMDVDSESEHYSNIDCGWTDMNSDSGDSFNIDYQVLGIVEVGTLDLPYSQLAITSGTTYDDLNTQLKQLKPNHDLAVTVPYFGPYPFFRYPFPSETISSSARNVYVIDQNECNTLVVVRTGNEDVVVPLALSDEEDRLLTIDVITAHIAVHGYSPVSVKDYTGQLDIGLRSLEAIKSFSKNAYPTIAFVETRSEGYDFHTQLKEDIPVTESINFLLARGEALVHRISHIESDDLQLVHLARAMIHLIVSSQEIMSTDNDPAIVDYCKDLHRIFDKLEECTEMINDSEETALSIFHELCENRPGAVAIRHSYDEFLKLNPRNSVPRDQIHSNTAQSTTSANQSVTRHHDDTRRGSDTELSDNVTIEPVFSSLALSGSPTGPIPSFQMDNALLTGTGAMESAIWTLRPKPEQVLDDIATYFPDHEVDKLITGLDSSASSPSDGRSPIAVDLPYSALSPSPPAQPTLSPPIALSAMDAPRPTLRPPLVGGNSRKPGLRLNIPAGASPLGGIGAYKPDVIDPVDDSVSTMAKRGRKNTNRLSQDDVTSGTVVGRRSTKFWGTSMKEHQPSDVRKLVNAEPLSLLPNLPVTRWAKGILIGKGTYGKVYFGFNMTTGEVIAVKRVEMPEASSEYQGSRQKQVLRAIKAKSTTLYELDHPNIVAYLGFEQTDKYFSIFLEYVPGSSVGECYRKLGHGFDQNLTRHCTRQILNGLAYIHSRGILHRDLKADNIFLDLEGNCKISGFGISKHEHDNLYGTNEAMTAMQGTVFWMAPEILVTQDGDSGQADIWSFGCVVLEMCTGDTPWAPKSSVAVILLLGNLDTRQAPPMPDDLNISLEGRDMLNQCFQLEPGARPTAEALKTHPYIGKAHHQQSSSFPSVLQHIKQIFHLDPNAPPTAEALKTHPYLGKAYHHRSPASPSVIRPQATVEQRDNRYNPSGPSGRLKERLDRMGLSGTYTAYLMGERNPDLWEVTFSLNREVIGQSGPHTRKAEAREEAAVRALEWLDMNNI